MAINLDFSSASNFISTIKKYCSSLEWSISAIDSQTAILNFEGDSGNTQTLFIIRHENTLEFSVPSGIKYTDINNIPEWLPITLLSQNSQHKIGFWCLEKIDGQEVFSIMHNAEISLINLEYFRNIAFVLVDKCDKFEQKFVKTMKAA